MTKEITKIVLTGFELPKLRLLHDIRTTTGGYTHSSIADQTFTGCLYGVKNKEYKPTPENMKIFEEMKKLSPKIFRLNKELRDLVEQLDERK